MEPPLILRIFYQATKAVAHMHSQSPPIVHRDIKIENYLLGDDKKLKLCDFGSATSEIFSPTLDWNAQQRNTLEDQVCCAIVSLKFFLYIVFLFLLPICFKVNQRYYTHVQSTRNARYLV